MAHAITASLQKAQKLINSGKLDKAASLCAKILETEPRQPDALHLIGLIALRKGHHDRAVRVISQAVKSRPNNALFHYNLGLAHQRTFQFDQAIRCFQQAIRLKPDLGDAYSDLCLVLRESGDIEKAIEAGKRALMLMPESPAAHYNLGIAYEAWKDFEAGLKHYKEAARLLPNHADIQFDLGCAYLGLGDTSNARRCFRKVTDLDPGRFEPYRHLARITDYTSPDHEDVSRLRNLLGRDGLKDDDRSELFFTLGKIYQDCSLYDDAFSCFRQGNELQDDKLRFDEEALIRDVTSVINFCTRDMFGDKHLPGNPSKTPVFIVGTPRSGTTLTEQILSSHSEVFGAGELDWFARVENAMPGYLDASTPYPECMRALKEEHIGELTRKYLQYGHSLASGHRKIIDKMPGNFMRLGLIHLFFPEAKIIHCRREPRDACISMYCQLFPGRLPYSYDLFKLGVYYAQYQRIMAHWRSVLPAGSMIEVDYESMVLDQETESRRLVEFLGLEWDDACLSFYKQNRLVQTASNLQVRKPVYSDSVGRWKNYRKYLAQLEKGFQYVGV